MMLYDARICERTTLASYLRVMTIREPYLASIAVNEGDRNVPDAPHKAESFWPINGREWEPFNAQQSSWRLVG